jgi:effector-binding domain-containing protein
MIETPEILQTDARHYASLRLTVPREESRHVIGPGIQEVYRVILAQGLNPTGPWFTHHLKNPDTLFDFEICVPVDEPIKPAGRVVPRVWPSMRVARTVCHGNYENRNGYEGLDAAWGEFEKWIAAQGLNEARDLWEVYRVNPDSSKDATDWRTELNRPLVD